MGPFNVNFNVAPNRKIIYESPEMKKLHLEKTDHVISLQIHHLVCDL